MENVEKIVLKMVGSKTNQNQYNLFKMKVCWADIIGNNNAKHCSPVKLERRILTLEVDSSVWSIRYDGHECGSEMVLFAFFSQIGKIDGFSTDGTDGSLSGYGSFLGAFNES